MRSIYEIERDLKANVTAALVPLQTNKNLNFSAFQRLVELASEGAVVLKGNQQLPRSFINEIFVSEQVIRRECQYQSDPRLLDTANQLKMIFGLILLGEIPSDRQPGVPRIL